MSDQPAPLLFLSHAGADTEAARKLKQRVEEAARTGTGPEGLVRQR